MFAIVICLVLSLLSVMSPQHTGTHSGDIMYFGCVCFRGELGFLNCADICMCVVNKQFDLL